jgi:hypothetical protein
VTVPLAAILWVCAWQLPSIAGEAAGAALIALACLTLAAAVARIAAPRAIQAGVVALIVLDLVLVWGTPQVGPTSAALAAVKPPSPAVLLLPRRPLPALQQVEFGPARCVAREAATPPLRGRDDRHGPRLGRTPGRHVADPGHDPAACRPPHGPQCCPTWKSATAACAGSARTVVLNVLRGVRYLPATAAT